ncbi:MAG: hypothetical protein R3F54_03170 [Alphaproteobacteria bacterium]
MDLRCVILALMIVLATPMAAMSSVLDIYNRFAGEDLARVRQDVHELAAAAEADIDNVGLGNAIVDFQKEPWRRKANGLHIWGVKVDGMSWFDAGHPELVGLQVGEMRDIEGRHWADMAIQSTTGTGPRTFEILYPHPRSGKAARLASVFHVGG